MTRMVTILVLCGGLLAAPAIASKHPIVSRKPGQPTADNTYPGKKGALQEALKRVLGNRTVIRKISRSDHAITITIGQGDGPPRWLNYQMESRKPTSAPHGGAEPVDEKAKDEIMFHNEGEPVRDAIKDLYYFMKGEGMFSEPETIPAIP